MIQNHLGVWGLREEARKSWDCIVSDEIVYRAKPIHMNYRRSFGRIPKSNSECANWSFLHFRLVGQRHFHYSSIIEHLDAIRNPFWNLDVKVGRVHRNQSVLSDVAKLIQLPQGMILEGLPSVVRLKRFDDGDCDCWNILRNPLEMPLAVRAQLPTHGELSSSIGSLCGQQGQLPSQMVERCPQTVQTVQRNNREALGGKRHLNPNDVPLILKIILGMDTERLRIVLVKDLQFLIESFEMLIPPTGQQFKFTYIET